MLTYIHLGQWCTTCFIASYLLRATLAKKYIIMLSGIDRFLKVLGTAYFGPGQKFFEDDSGFGRVRRNQRGMCVPFVDFQAARH